MERRGTEERLVTKERERMSLYIVFTHGSNPVTATFAMSSWKMTNAFGDFSTFYGAHCLGTAVLSATESEGLQKCRLEALGQGEALVADTKN